MHPQHLETRIQTIVAAGPSWLPPAVWSTVILLVAAGLALLLHGASLEVFKHLSPPRKVRSFWEALIENTIGPSRLAYVVFLVGAALPSTNFTLPTTLAIAHGLLVAFILLVGWSSMRSLEIAATLYLHHFRTDVDDNLRARKHLTQIRILKRGRRYPHWRCHCRGRTNDVRPGAAIRAESFRLRRRREPCSRPGGPATADQPYRRCADRDHPADPVGGRGDRGG